MSTPAPELTQRERALNKANRVRIDRAALRRQLRTQPTRAQAVALCAELLTQPPTELESMSVGMLLTSCRRIGRAHAHQLLRAAQASELRRIADLSARQRERLVRGLRAMA